MSRFEFLKDRYAKLGIAGLITWGLCCLTPVLGFVIGALGLAATTAYLNYILPTLLLVSAALLGFAYYRYRKKQSMAPNAHRKDSLDIKTIDDEIH
ncbi:MAG TPA: mercury resistance system transport protein MerF [Bacteroidales bacterium]|nr:mercury resistance system transport protein MerF [Bacteroidales bacterium]